MARDHFQLQLHVMPTELLGWLDGWRNRHRLSARLIYYSPRRSRLIRSNASLQGVVKSYGWPDEIVLSHYRPRNTRDDEVSAVDDLRATGEGITVLMPEHTVKGLRQAIIAVDSKNWKSKSPWREIVRDIRARTRAGMWVINPALNVSRFYRSLRFTEEAAMAARKGMVLLPVAGDNVMRVDPPQK